MSNLPTDERNVDTHDPAGYAAFLRERAKANREIAALPREQWPYRPAVLQHWALRFDQGADLIEGLVADFEHMKKARDRDHEQAWMNGAAALRYRNALEIVALDPGVPARVRSVCQLALHPDVGGSSGS